MARTYWYRTCKATWGIAIGLTAEGLPRAAYHGQAIEAADGLWLVTTLPKWGNTPFMADRPEMWHYLAVGLRLVAEPMRAIVEAQGPLAVRILELKFAATDYQDEALAPALAGWLAEEYGFSYSAPPVDFDRDNNQYRFIFPETALPVEPALIPGER